MKNQPRYRLVAFDLDGTLTDTLTSIAVSANAVLLDLGQPPLDITVFPDLIGYGAKELVKGFLTVSYGGKPDQAFVEETYASYRQHFAENCTVGIHPFKFIPDLLNDLKQAGVKLAVVSNKPHRETETIVRSLFTGVFDAVCGQKDEGPRKPDPIVLLTLLDRFDLAAESACMVGDGDTDVQVGQRAGVDQIACGWGYRSTDHLLSLNPTAYAADVASLRALLFQSA